MITNKLHTNEVTILNIPNGNIVTPIRVFDIKIDNTVGVFYDIESVLRVESDITGTITHSIYHTSNSTIIDPTDPTNTLIKSVTFNNTTTNFTRRSGLHSRIYVRNNGLTYHSGPGSQRTEWVTNGTFTGSLLFLNITNIMTFYISVSLNFVETVSSPDPIINNPYVMIKKIKV
jgi:hypothetical protein